MEGTVNELEAFVEEWARGDRSKAREMARAYVNAHREGLAPVLERLSLVDIVKLIDGYREYGQWDNVAVAEMWLLVNYEPQKINGAVSIGGGQALIEAVADAMNRGEAL